jgi:valyl-tRNA synthetase
MESRYEHTSWEKKFQEQWEKEKTYTRQHNPGQSYSIDTPPPTVSGSLHIGHVFSYTQTDILARYKRMNGFSVFYPFGFDDNGLATERFVEKKCKVRSHELGRTNFINLCLKETAEAEHQFKELWTRMGLSVDWQEAYSTISAPVRRLSQASFIDLYKKGFIYRKHAPALYCPTCRTTVAQAELDDAQKPSFFNDIVFKDHKGHDLIVSTTRPELLPACVALFYNPADKRYTYLKDTQVAVPVFNFQVPVLADDKVDMEKGSGLVMCCTFGDKTDIFWFKKHNLPYKQALGLDGRMTQHAGILGGLSVKDARIKIIEELIAKNLLIAQKEISHSVNIHERCKHEIEFLMLSQWFINILEHKQKFLELADQVNWYPSFMKSRYKDWVENLGWDWCISRQRFFGIPFPAWHCQDCGHVILADEKTLPIDPQETAHTGTCPKCSSSNIKGDTDVMDTWNTSSITPYICGELYNKKQVNFGAEKNSPDTKAVFDFLPMSMRPQAHDIIRTWAFYTIVKSWMHHDVIPWKSIVISGHVLSDSKEKLSKSRECGAVTPENMLNCFPADAIRFWTASGRLGQDVAFSENQLKIGLRLVTKLWNAFRFTQEHVAALSTPHKAPENFGTIHEWLLQRASDTFVSYKNYLEQQEFSLALEPLEKFFWHDFCDNYLELVKHQLFNPHEYTEQEVYATRWTLYHVGLRILQMYAPYLPYITEALYEQLYKHYEKTASIHQTRFENYQTEWVFDENAALIEKVIALVAQVRTLKTEQQLSLKTPLEVLAISSNNDQLLGQFKKLEKLIRGVTQAKEIQYTVGTEKPAVIEKKAELFHAQVYIAADTISPQIF